MREDKAAIVKKLEELLNLTREGTIELEYKKDYLVRGWDAETIIGMFDEAVVVREEGMIVAQVNVSWDSGVALVRDVLSRAYCN